MPAVTFVTAGISSLKEQEPAHLMGIMAHIILKSTYTVYFFIKH